LELCIVPPEPRRPFSVEGPYFEVLTRAVNPRPAISNEPFFQTRPEDREDDKTIFQAPMRELVHRWSEFYSAPLNAALVAALNLPETPDAGDTYAYAVHIHRRTDSLSQKSIAYAFDFVAGEKVLHAKVMDWVRSCEPPTHLDSQGERGVYNYLEGKRHSQQRRPGWIPMQVFLYATGSEGGRTTHVETSLTQFFPYEYNFFSQWLDIQDPFGYLKDTVDKGRYVTPAHIVRASTFEYDAWGFPAYPRDLTMLVRHKEERRTTALKVNQPIPST
jgi:hypothetical protein